MKLRDLSMGRCKNDVSRQIERTQNTKGHGASLHRQ